MSFADHVKVIPMPSSSTRPNQPNTDKSNGKNNSRSQSYTINKSPLRAYNNYPSGLALLLQDAQARALLAQARVKEAALEVKVADLVEKRRGISNKEVAINASIAVLEAKKAALRAELRFTTIPASFICRDPVPFKHIIELTPSTTIPSYIASVAPPLIEDEQLIISFGDANKDII